MGVYKGPQPNVFRAVSGSLFSSPINWSRGFVPTSSDVATIADNCIIDISRTVGGLVVRPGFTASISGGLTLQVNDVVNILGHLSCSGAPNITLLGRKNNINSFSPASSSFLYSGSTNQNIPGLTYYNLTIGGINTKRLSSALVVNNNLSLTNASNTQLFFDLDRYPVTVYNTASIGANEYATIARSNYGGSYFFGPALFIGRGNLNNYYVMDFPASPFVEFKNGLLLTSANNSSNLVNTGTGVFYFTTSSNQTLRVAANINATIALDADISIASGVTLTTVGSFAALTGIKGRINGADSTSRWVNAGQFSLASEKAANSMTTGAFDFTSSNNLVGFVGDYTTTLPSYFNTFSNLLIGGTGTKTAGANITVSGSFNGGYAATAFSSNGGTFDMGAYNLIVSGNATTNIFIKSRPGNLTFIGRLTISNPQRATDFSGGNPNVELRGGLSEGGSNPDPRCLYSGTGSWVFTTNNQNITWWNQFYPFHFEAPITISGSIALTLASSANMIISRSINGTSGSSQLINSGSLSFATAQSLTGSMLTGSYIFNIPNTAIGIGGDYTATIPARFNNFSNLSISGLGTKSLATDTYISGSLTLSSNGILELSSSNLIVSGTTNISQTTTLQKTSAGGTASFYGGISFPQGIGTLNFTSSNPYVEVRNGIFIGNNIPIFRSGNNKWIFSTNNQTITNNNGPGSGMGLGFECPIIISGPISLSLSAPAGSRLYLDLYSPIDGDHPSSSFINTDGVLNFYTSASTNCMTTSGTINYSPITTNIHAGIGYYMNQNFTIPLNLFNNLYIGGAGIKTLGSNTVLRKGLTINFPSTFDADNYDLVITGSVSIGAPGTYFKKSGPGKITIGGSLGIGNGWLDFSTGSTDVELKGGITLGNGLYLTGTGSWYFSGPSQGIAFGVGNDDSITFRGKGLISSSAQLALTTSYASPATFTMIFPSGAYINGESSTSVFNNRKNVIYQNPDAPMLTGSLWSNAGSFTYNYTGSQTQSIQVPTDPVNPSNLNLTLSGSTKILLGNINVTGTIITGSTLINYNGFTITKI